MARPVKGIGFTGTRKGMTPVQAGILKANLERLAPEVVHHGDCLGADAQLHDLAIDLRIRVVVHPPEDPKHRAWCDFPPGREGGSIVFVRRPKPYIERDHDIVDHTEMLVATPGENRERRRSGTWTTVRYARKVKKPILIILPNGTRWEEEPDTLFGGG